MDMLDAVRKYYDGSQPLTDRQHLVRLEMSKLPLDSISAFFGALRRVASTIEAGEGEYRRFTETMTLTESMVHDLFGEAVRQQQYLSAKNRDALEGKFVTLIKAKMLSAKDFSFVKAAADAQQTIMKDMKEIGRDGDRRGDDPRRAPGGFNPNPTCFECGKRGHKSFECIEGGRGHPQGAQGGPSGTAAVIRGRARGGGRGETAERSISIVPAP